MSEDGLVNLEDDAPVAAAAPPAEPPPAPAPPAPEPPQAPPEPEEPDAIDVDGQKLVPVSAVLAERRQRQALSAKVQGLEAYQRESQPYVDFLKANPGLIQGRQPAAPAAPEPVAPDPQTESLAKTLDLYTPEGKPDLARAGTIRQMMQSEAQQIANQAVAPWQQESAQNRSARNFQVALTTKDANGRTPSPQALTQIWRNVPAEQSADPNVAAILALTALGLDSVSARPVIAPPGQPPIVTESQGNGQRRPSLSAIEERVARDRGITDKTWAENTKGFVSGRAVTLED